MTEEIPASLHQRIEHQQEQLQTHNNTGGDHKILSSTEHRVAARVSSSAFASTATSVSVSASVAASTGTSTTRSSQDKNGVVLPLHAVSLEERDDDPNMVTLSLDEPHSPIARTFPTTVVETTTPNTSNVRKNHHHNSVVSIPCRLTPNTANTTTTSRTTSMHTGSTKSNNNTNMYPPRQQKQQQQQHMSESLHDGWSELSSTLQVRIGEPSARAVTKFFYPQSTNTNNHDGGDDGDDDDYRRSNQLAPSSPPPNDPNNPNQALPVTLHALRLSSKIKEQEEQDRKWMERFWKTYDDIIILSIFGQLGIVIRLAAAHWFAYFDDIFNRSSPLFTNLPLNCFSCFLMGFLGSGNDVIEIVNTRKTTTVIHQPFLHSSIVPPPQGEESSQDQDQRQEGEQQQQQQQQHTNHENDNGYAHSSDDDASDNTNNYNEHGNHDEEQASNRTVSQGPDSRTGTVRQRHTRRPQTQHDLPEWLRKDDGTADDEFREVQLQALERRIRASPCLVLFPGTKEGTDVMEHYYDIDRFQGKGQITPLVDIPGGASDSTDMYRSSSRGNRSQMHNKNSLYDLELDEEENESTSTRATLRERPDDSKNQKPVASDEEDARSSFSAPNERNDVDTHSDTAPTGSITGSSGGGATDAYPHGEGLGTVMHDMTSTINTNISRMQRINIADGWDVGTTPKAMSDDLLLGLRIGFCGALSSFTSWNSSMVNLLKNGQVGEAFIGYLIGLQLPIVSYRFGQHASVYLFVWRCRREARRDDRRGYGIKVRLDDDDDDNDMSTDDDNEDGNPIGTISSSSVHSAHNRSTGNKNKNSRTAANTAAGRIVDEEAADRNIPSVRAISTAIFMTALVTEITAISFFRERQSKQIAISLLFSPFGVLARWRLIKFNSWRPGFPLGTFACNLLACALSGGLGRLIAGNPGPEESIVLFAMISGFSGSLSSLASFVMEILKGIDPIIFKWDGITYCMATIWWAFLIGFLSRGSKDWADESSAQLSISDDR